MAEQDKPNLQEEPIDGGITPEQEEMLARFEEQVRRMTVDEHLVAMTQSLATLAVHKMKVIPEADAHKDMEQARMAIDVIKVLLPFLELSRPIDEVHVHRKMLSDLQMAYVEALNKPSVSAKVPEADEASQEAESDAG